jgi:macrolide-specific efflux system membrane fusion protein
MLGRLLAALSAAGLLLAGMSDAPAADIEIPSALVKLLEQVEVPAREAGALEKLLVREGELVAAGAAIGKIDDRAPAFDKSKAEIELAGAKKLAASDVKVRFAKKSAEVAAAELQRALESAARLAESVTASELDQLKLVAEKTKLEIEQAELEHELARTTVALKQNDLATAEHAISQRQIAAPLAGFVAQVLKQPGEWVEPGEPIARILRLDRLKVEGLASADSLDGSLMGRRVTLTVVQGQKPVQYSGKIAFVSPEVDPVNGQVRFWAEIENADLSLRPGLHGSLTISAAEGEQLTREESAGQ